jgi:hypothetical protein
MVHIAHHLVKAFLNALGMTEREQLITFAAVALLAFALYAGNRFASQKVFATLYLTLGLAFCVFMTTDRPQTRIAAGAALCAAVCAMFVWYFVTRTLERSESPRDT